ncbi:MAG: pentapeptide repeat-containing protein, partial [Eggerthella sp.]|nr:pentapeptide repeat-containing protein [Eggerthella sp.]
MHVIPSSAQAAYDQASSPCKLTAPRIAASLDDMPLSALCDPDRGTLEAVEFCGLHATEASFVELEVSSGRFSNCQFLSCDFTGALLVDIAFEGCNFSNSIFDSAAFTRCTFSDCKFAGASFTEALWEQVAAKDCTFAYGAFNRCLWKIVRAHTC